MKFRGLASSVWVQERQFQKNASAILLETGRFEGLTGRVDLAYKPGPLNLIVQAKRFSMANTRSAKKAARGAVKKTAINTARKSRIRTFIRAVEEAVASGDKARAAEALKAAQPEIMRGVTKKVLPKNAASRKVSRLAKRVKALS